MNLTVTLEYRFDRTPDGAIWSQTAFSYDFWTRYLDVFDSVRIVARTLDTPTPPDGAKRVDGERVNFWPVPYYIGPRQYLMKRRSVRCAVRAAVDPHDALILRVGSQLAAALDSYLRKSGRPYAVEVVGDPYDVFAPGAVRHPLRAFFRWWFARQLRRQCAKACAAAYVTVATLQKRYPPAPEAFTTHYSSIELDDAAFITEPRAFFRRLNPVTLITVGTLAQLYKAPDVLIDAVALSVANGLDLKLVIVGDGKYRPELEAQAASLGLGERVEFVGQLPAGKPVRDQLDRADLFVLPSRQEGLPRAMIEAMARGLPCIGSTVGGIPELLPPEDLVPPGDAIALAGKIAEFVQNPEHMARASARNLQKAREYRDELLRQRRNAFYKVVREKTEEWLKGR